MLILVVWTITLLSVLAASLGSRGIFALSLTQRYEQQLRASQIAAAGIARAQWLLASDLTPQRDGAGESWANNEAILGSQAFGGGTFTVAAPQATPGARRYGLVDEERRLNLNTATTEILRRLLQQTAALRDNEAAEIADAIIDWRDEDTKPLKDGAEDFDYLARRPAYECKDSPFEQVEELLLVRGVTPALYARLAPHVTTYGSGQVNINTAGPVVLRALGISEQGIEGLRWYRAGEDSLDGTTDDRALSDVGAAAAELGAALPAEDANRLTRLAGLGLAGVKSDAFLAAAEGRVEGARETVVRIAGIIDRAGRRHAWSERE